VVVSRDGDQVVVVVKDDGRGGARIEPGGGLEGLRDRVETVGGHVEVRSVAGLGTIVELVVPAQAIESGRPGA
jgi:signal transduction histidine kinase